MNKIQHLNHRDDKCISMIYHVHWSMHVLYVLLVKGLTLHVEFFMQRMMPYHNVRKY